MSNKSTGHGLYINTSTGSVLVDRSSEVADNQADGIKYNFHHREPDKSASDTFQDFCAGASNLNQAYPLVTVATQERHSYNELDCEKVKLAIILPIFLTPFVLYILNALVSGMPYHFLWPCCS